MALATQRAQPDARPGPSSSWSTGARLVPRVHDRHAAVSEITDVAGCDHSVLRSGDGCDQPVEAVQRAPSPLACGDHLSIDRRGGCIEPEHPWSETARDEGVKLGFEVEPPPALGHAR